MIWKGFKMKNVLKFIYCTFGRHVPKIDYKNNEYILDKKGRMFCERCNVRLRPPYSLEIKYLPSKKKYYVVESEYPVKFNVHKLSKEELEKYKVKR
jgi:hypothetical protein